MVSWLIFKSFIHLEFIFVYGVSWWSSFLLFACGCPDLPTQFAEEDIFTPFYASASFVKYWLTTETWVYFWPLYSVPLIYVSFLMPVSDCFDYCGFVIYFDIRYCDPSYLFFFLKIAAAIQGRLWFHINFLKIYFIDYAITVVPIFLLFPPPPGTFLLPAPPTPP